MIGVNIRPGEDIESLIKRFKIAVERSGILQDARDHEYFQSPSLKRHYKDVQIRYKQKINRKYNTETKKEF